MRRLAFILVLLLAPAAWADTVTVASNSITTANGDAWGTPSNSYATTGNDSYATVVVDKRNETHRSQWGFAAIGSGTIPDSSTINSVRCEVEWGVTNVDAIITLELQTWDNNAAAYVGTQTADATEPTTDTADTQTATGATLTQLRNGYLDCEATCNNANSPSTSGCRVDYMRMFIDYTPPAAGGRTRRMF